jgi:hypothetical protein
MSQHQEDNLRIFLQEYISELNGKMQILSGIRGQIENEINRLNDEDIISLKTFQESTSTQLKTKKEHVDSICKEQQKQDKVCSKLEYDVKEIELKFSYQNELGELYKRQINFIIHLKNVLDQKHNEMSNKIQELNDNVQIQQQTLRQNLQIWSQNVSEIEEAFEEYKKQAKEVADELMADYINKLNRLDYERLETDQQRQDFRVLHSLVYSPEETLRKTREIQHAQQGQPLANQQGGKNYKYKYQKYTKKCDLLKKYH